MLAVVYVMFNEGFVSSTGATQDRDLAADAVWLAEVVATSLPDEAEAWGLAALLPSSTPARPRASTRAAGWCCCATRTGPAGTPPRSPPREALPRPGRRAATGPAPTSCRPRSPPATPPARRGRRPTGCRSSPCTTSCCPPRPSPVTRLNRAVALAQLGPDHADRALADVDALAEPARRLPPLPRDPRPSCSPASAATTRRPPPTERALALTTNDAERRLLTTRLHRHPLSDGS